jgi:PIN domain nuclease of toxin-antitoxin system
MVEKLISPVNALELTQKYRVGKLDEAAPFLHNGRLVLDDYAVASLPITLEHASLAGSMDIAHKDPFDRLLIAQSIIERVPLVSNEALFDHFGVERIW